MMKSILISIKPEYVEKILNGEKTLEIRSTVPKEWKAYLKGKTSIKPAPSIWYIYCTNGNRLYDLSKCGVDDLEQKVKEKKNKRFILSDLKSNNIIGSSVPLANRKVVAEFTLKNISYWQPYWTPEVMHICDISEKSCVSIEDLMKYCGNETIYALHIEDLKIYDKPKLLQEFFKPCDGCNKIGSRRCTDEVISDCRAKVITRPPQSWMFVGSLEKK